MSYLICRCTPLCMKAHGGNLVLSYAALQPEKVRNVITVATPGDSDADNTLLSLWTKKMKVDILLDAFGNVPSALLNAAFELRSPVEYLLKYPLFFERPHDLESILEFFVSNSDSYNLIISDYKMKHMIKHRAGSVLSALSAMHGDVNRIHIA